MRALNKINFMKILVRTAVFFTVTSLAAVAFAHEFKLGNILIGHPYARATAPQQTAAGAYLSLENQGKTDDKLLKAEAEIAKTIDIHNMEMTGDIMKMREVDGIDLKAGTKLSMKPGGGYHIMLTGLSHGLKAGEQFPMTLYFSKAGKIEVIVHVESDVDDKTPSN